MRRKTFPVFMRKHSKAITWWWAYERKKGMASSNVTVRVSSILYLEFCLEFGLTGRQEIFEFFLIRSPEAFAKCASNSDLFLPPSSGWDSTQFIFSLHIIRGRLDAHRTLLGNFLRLASNTIIAYTQIPLKLVTWTGIIMSLVTFALAVIFFARSLLFGTTVAGWASLIISVLFMGSVQIALIGIVGLYIGKTFEEAKRRPLYIVNDTLNLDVGGALKRHEIF